ncbi:MAG TPA: non-ribosomal peptide synthetase, partial [Anaerolineae bacterium]|nr:non-ribosomal peptide synthetase [Anaerolineae bacterium]
AATVPIGRPIANTQTWVLDPRGQPVPIGIPGELHIAGHNLARGYLNRPELTEDKFSVFSFQFSVDDSLNSENCTLKTVYKTGDLVRYLPDGNLEFLGRVDRQVKIRGFRVELSEIETSLNRHPQVREGVVIAWEDAAGLGPKQLVAYFTAAAEPPPTTSDLRRFLGETLPEYMIPAAFVPLAQMPLTPSGKIDRHSLPEPDNLRPDLAAEFVAPRTPMEELLANVWQELLGVEKVGVYDDFFELGGHSLLATQLISRLRGQFPAQLSLRALFESPTIAGLAEQLTLAQQSANGRTLPPIQPVPQDAERPLSFAQQRMWFLHQMEPDSPEYNIPDVVRLRGHLDLPALETSVNAIIRRHETLRTAFLTVDGRPQLQIADDLTLAIPLIDLRHLPPAEREAEALRRAEAEAVRPFNLTKPPLLRLTLLQLDEEEYLALLTMHHIVADGWSMGVFIRELAAGYTAVTQNQPRALPELPIQYSDFAWWQRNWLQGDALEEQLAYWREKLADAPPLLELPTDHPRPAVQTHRGAHLPFTLSADLTRRLKEISRQTDATLFMTLLAAFQTLLSRYARQEDVCVGTPIANRNRAEIEGLIGFFVNTLTLRADLSGNPAFTELLRQVRETTLEAYAHQDVPFDKVVDALQPERNMSHSPLFQVMFTWQNAPKAAISLPDLRLESLPVENHVANFDLTLVLEETPDGLAGGFEYNADLFAAKTIERMMTHFQTLLAGIAENPQTGVADLPLLPEEEWRQMQAWNDTAVPLPDQPIHYLIAAKAAKTPDTVAVRQGAAQYTYRELDARANQLAHYLQQQGVGPDKLVGVALSRSPEMIAALLGILKAGGAYLPLDPDYPPERLAFMIQDAQPVLILTDDSQVVESSDSRVVLLSGSQIVELPDRHTSQLSDYQTTRLPDYSTNLDSLAYVIYTSGSTGQPKGVMIPHRGVLNHNLAAQKLFDLRPSDRVWQFATINFDTAVEEIFPTLLTGATLVLRQPELPAVTELCQIIRREELTVLDLPTAYWHEWVYELAQSDTAVPNCLRLVVVGGDKANAAELRLWQKITADTAVTWLNTYGPTETTIIATSYQADG